MFERCVVCPECKRVIMRVPAHKNEVKPIHIQICCECEDISFKGHNLIRESFGLSQLSSDILRAWEQMIINNFELSYNGKEGFLLKDPCLREHWTNNCNSINSDYPDCLS